MYGGRRSPSRGEGAQGWSKDTPDAPDAPYGINGHDERNCTHPPRSKLAENATQARHRTIGGSVEQNGRPLGGGSPHPRPDRSDGRGGAHPD
jgi:hypothetical protein